MATSGGYGICRYLETKSDGRCPLTENAYSPESMEGRVSRYPFPDHNPPPLPLLPLAVREMTAWLKGDPERIAIIHCKAGKGRSGTLLVSYLLSLPELPPPPRDEGPGLESSVKEDVKDKLKETVKQPAHDSTKHDEDVAEHDEEDAESEHVGIDTSDDEGPPLQAPVAVAATPSHLQKADTHVSPVTTPVQPKPKDTYSPMAIGDEDDVTAPGQHDRLDGKLDEIFKFHSSRRMKPSTTKSRRGVSIASRMSVPM